MWPAVVLSFFIATLKLLTNALHKFRGRPTLKDDERFRNGSNQVHETLAMNYVIMSDYMRNYLRYQTEFKCNSHELTNEITTETSDENCFAKQCEYHKSDVQRPNSLKENDAMKLADDNNLILSEISSVKVNIILTCITVICIVMFNSIVFHKSCLLVTLSAILFILCSLVYMCKRIDKSIANFFNECDIFEKAEQLCPSEYVEHEESTIYPRSRYAQFIYFERVKRRRHIGIDREPSRIPVRQLERAFGKSRKIRRAVRQYIRRNIPRSSKIHQFTWKSTFSRKECFTNYARKGGVRKRINSIKVTRNKRQTRFSETARLHHSNLFHLHSVEEVYKDFNHRVKCNEFNLSKDIEKNPGPVFVDAAKTITAPYSQDNVVFGLNAGSQCAAMALTSLIYNHRNRIKSSLDLVNILNIGNELYSGVSKLSRQSYLMLTELPEVVNMFNTNYRLHYSPSYTGTVQGSCALVDYNFCMPLTNAIETLLEGNYNAFLLTIQCNTVGIYCTADGKFKIFDSHARDSRGMVHPEGTCVLLELQNLNNLLSYVQEFYKSSNVQYELKGVQVSEIQYETNDCSHQLANTTTSNITALKCCCAISFYCICFSLIKACGYWNSQTLDSIAEQGKIFYREKLQAENRLTIDNFPSILQIYDADIHITFNLEKKGILCSTSLASKLILHKLITDNKKDNTGFLMWISNYCISCIFCNNSKSKRCGKYYLTVFTDIGNVKMFQSIHDTDYLIETFFNTVKEQYHSSELEYYIRFLSCSSTLSNDVRQRVKRKHTFNSKKEAKRKKKNYAELSSEEKQKLLSQRSERYNSMNLFEKEKLLFKKAEWYKSLNPEEKEKLSSRKAEWYKSLNPEEKEKLLSSRTEWYKSLNPEEKEKLLSSRAEWYESLDLVKKEKLLIQKRFNMQEARQLKEVEILSLDHCISVFQSKIKDGPYYICLVCNRILYRKTVCYFRKNKYNCIQSIFTDIKSFDGKQYICKTCHSKVLQGKVPSQAACNKLQVDDIPPELAVLEKLEQILVAQRIVFEKNCSNA